MMPAGHAPATAPELACSLNLSIRNLQRLPLSKPDNSANSRSNNRLDSLRGEADCKSQTRHCFLTQHAHIVQAEVRIVLCTLLSKNSMFGFHTQILTQRSARQLPHCKSDLWPRRRPSFIFNVYFLIVLLTWTVTL